MASFQTTLLARLEAQSQASKNEQNRLLAKKREEERQKAVEREAQEQLRKKQEADKYYRRKGGGLFGHRGASSTPLGGGISKGKGTRAALNSNRAKGKSSSGKRRGGGGAFGKKKFATAEEEEQSRIKDDLSKTSHSAIMRRRENKLNGQSKPLPGMEFVMRKSDLDKGKNKLNSNSNKSRAADTDYSDLLGTDPLSKIKGSALKYHNKLDTTNTNNNKTNSSNNNGNDSTTNSISDKEKENNENLLKRERARKMMREAKEQAEKDKRNGKVSDSKRNKRRLESSNQDWVKIDRPMGKYSAEELAMTNVASSESKSAPNSLAAKAALEAKRKEDLAKRKKALFDSFGAKESSANKPTSNNSPRENNKRSRYNDPDEDERDHFIVSDDDIEPAPRLKRRKSDIYESDSDHDRYTRRPSVKSRNDDERRNSWKRKMSDRDDIRDKDRYRRRQSRDDDDYDRRKRGRYEDEDRNPRRKLNKHNVYSDEEDSEDELDRRYRRRSSSGYKRKENRRHSPVSKGYRSDEFSDVDDDDRGGKYQNRFPVFNDLDEIEEEEEISSRVAKLEDKREMIKEKKRQAEKERKRKEYYGSDEDSD